MRTIGIDYGTKRIGVAVSDEAGQFAMPVTVIANAGDVVAAEVAKLCAEYGTAEVVLGESRQYDMSPNKILPAILTFKEELEALKLRVYLELEFMTSFEAERFQGKHDKIDASAAALILQSFLDRRRNQTEP